MSNCLFEPLACLEDSVAVTNIMDLNSEFMSTMACCEEGQCCDPW